MKLKRILAVAMATTMVLGMSMTAFAEPVTSGTQDGTGAPEGHVDKSLVNVVLPTVPAGTFNYTMDPERLIQVTSHEKYAEGTVFPEAADDTGVYFLVGENEYANASKEMQVINKSSDAVKVDVKVKVTTADTDIPLATAALTDSETAAKLYLAAVVGEGENAETKILNTSEQTVTKKLAGNPDNFEIVVEDNDGTKSYAYKQKTAGLTAWKALKFSVKGAVTKDLPIASTTTAPTITLTWSYGAVGEVTDETGVGTATEDAAPSIATTTYTAAETDDVNVTVNLGVGNLAATGISSITYLSPSNSTKTVAAASYSLTGTTLKIDKSVVAAIRSAGLTSRTFTITFNDTAATTKQITINVSQ